MKNFVIVAELRSGYQMMATALNSHPSVFCFGEIFGSDRNIRKKSLFNQKIPVIEDNDDPVLYVNTLNKYGEKTKKKAIGFKLNYVCARTPNWSNLWNHIVKNNWSVIHLTRKNLLNRLMSQLLAQQENNWNHKKYHTKITIDPSKFLFWCNQSFNWQNQLRSQMKPSQLMEIVYEDVEYDMQKEFNKVQEFIGVQPRQLKTPMKKQQTRTQSSVINNYRQLYTSVVKSNSHLAGFFEDNLFL